MTATVGLRSGFSRHWTGSLLELNCNGLENLSDYPDISLENPFYLNWRTESSSEFESLQGVNGNDCTCMTPGVYTKKENPRFGENDFIASSNLTPNQAFRLRQLISLCVRYGKATSGYSGQYSWNSVGSSQTNHSLDASNLSDSSSQNFMRSLGRPDAFTNNHRLLQALFDANLESGFSKETGFVLLSKSKRRHCSSEGDLTFLNSEHHSPVQNDRLFNSVLNIANSSVDSKTQLANQNLTSGSSVETLVEANESPVFADNESRVPTPSVDNSTNQSIIEDVNIQSDNSETSSTDSLSSYGKEKNENSFEETSESTSTSTTSADPTETVQPNKPETPVSKQLLQLKISQNENVDAMNCAFPTIRAVQSELSSPQVRKLERENSTASESSSRLVKTVSFADEVGQSLTEVFLFRKTEEESLIPDYEDDFDGPYFNFHNKPKISSFGKFTRVRPKRFTDNYSKFTLGALPPIAPADQQNATRVNAYTDTSRRLWFLAFTQPAAQYYEFRQRVEHKCVSLENIMLTQPEDYSQHGQKEFDDRTQVQRQQLPYLSGTVKVKNIHFDKKVWLRITTDHWVSYVDCPATYSAELSSGGVRGSTRFDTFTFQITTSDYPCEVSNAEQIEFAIRYCAGPDGSHGQFWDNNDGRNYVIERRRVESGWSSPTNSSPSLTTTPVNNPYTGLSGYSSHETTSASSNTCNPYTLDYRPNFAGISSFTDYRAWEHFASESIYY